MNNKKGNVSVIALIVILLVITAGVTTWLFTTKSQAPVQNEVATLPQTESVAKKQIDVSNQDPASIPENKNTFVVTGTYVKGPKEQKEWTLGPRIDNVYFIADDVNDLPPGSYLSGVFFFSENVDELFGLKDEVVDIGNGTGCGYSGKATIEVSNYKPQVESGPISDDSAQLNQIINKEMYSKNCFNLEE